MPATETKPKRTRSLGAIYIETMLAAAAATSPTASWRRVNPVLPDRSPGDPCATVSEAEEWIEANGQPDSYYRIVREVATFRIQTKKTAVRD